MMHRLACVGLGAALLALGGCGGSDETDVDTSRASEFGFQTSTMTSLLEEGGTAYRQYCMGCHGEKGDGNGEAAGFFSPQPRNFQVANFKFSSTRSGQLPLDSDLERTIRYGLKGSAMPAFRWLPQRTVDALIAYVKTFSPKWTERGQPQPIPFVADPYRTLDDKSEAIARGEQVYHGYSACWSCHPSYVSNQTISEYRKAVKLPIQDIYREGIDHAEGKENSEGELIFPPDFARDLVRSGAGVDSLYRSIAAGISGTAMPTWVDSMDYAADGETLITPADLWAMAYYVQHLIRQRPPKLAEGAFVVRDRPKTIHLHGLPPRVAKPEAPAPEEGAEMEVEF